MINRYGVALLDAIHDKDYAKVKALILDGESLGCYEHNNYSETTPLIESIKIEDYNLVELLLDSGADINERAAFYDTPLSVAVLEVENFKITKLLISRGADVNARQLAASIPSRLLWQRNENESKFIKLTSSQREILDTLLGSGYIHKPKINDVCNSLYQQSLLSNDIDTLTLLIKHKEKLSQKSTYKAAQKACEVGNLEAVEILLQNKLKPTPKSAKTDILNGLLLYGIYSLNVNMVKLLFKYKASLEVEESIDQASYVSIAVKSGNIDILRLILEEGGCPNKRSESNRHIAPIIQATLDGRCDMVQELLKYGAVYDVTAVFFENNYENSYVKTALDIANEKGFIDIVESLEQSAEF